MRKNILVRNISIYDISRAEALQRAWPHDISRAEALRIAITRGLDASPEIEELMNRETATGMIFRAADLYGLCDAIENIEDMLMRDADGDPDRLLRIDELIDIASLPTYGGTTPRDTEGVWSWDSTHWLIHDNGWRIERRTDRV